MSTNVRADGRVEYVCGHGVGHTVEVPKGHEGAGYWVHGCDGCCPYLAVNSSGQRYYLHGKDVVLKDARIMPVYYFARTIRAEVLYELPEGFEVTWNTQTGMPVLKRIEDGQPN
jgi:hypothetical protein